ncbi:uncharacterized protein LOC135120710 [Zophobas morio]|uniref:uncharacterized protein LOC135120710 n=1 Tax=Zophobas morio TaxID=2755281 RepID=UPI003083BEBA
MLIIISATTMGYTFFGGLKISIMTDRIQAAVVLVLLSVVAMYTFITLKFSLQEKNISQFLGANEWGYSSLFVMPVAFLCVTLFSESFWQKAWASENKKILRRGALISSLMNFIVIFIFCLFGLFGLLSGRTDANTNEILRVFYIINSEYEPHKTGFVVKSFMGLLLVVSAFIMGTSALDSLQNGIVASISGVLSPRLPPRAIVLASCDLNALDLFAVSNILATMTAFPIGLGIFTKLKFSMYITDCVPFLSFCLSLLSTMVYACCVEWKKEVAFGVNLLRGLRKALYGNEYSWKFYAVSFFSSILATALLSFINYLRLRKFFINFTRIVLKSSKSSAK